MSKFSLSPDMKLEVKLRLIAKGSDTPLTGPAYKVRLFDKDFIGAEYLGESALDEHGVANIVFPPDTFSVWNDLDGMPDLYFTVLKNDVEIFRSAVMQDLDVEAIEQFRMGEGEVVDLGSFLVEG